MFISGDKFTEISTVQVLIPNILISILKTFVTVN